MIPREVRETALRGQPDRYIAATLAPVAVRPALAAIAAFAAELARIPATVSEPMLGDIRLQWWRDALADGARGIRSGHPVADALVDAVREHDLSAETIHAMIDAREFDLAGGIPSDDEGSAGYLEAVEAGAFRLALTVVGATPAAIAELSRAAGRAYGLARGLGRLPVLVHNGGVFIAAGRLKAAGLDPARLAESPPSPEALAAVVKIAADFRAEAITALQDVRMKWGQLSRGDRAALLPLAMVEPYFRAQSGRSLLTELADVAPLTRVIRIGIAHFTGRL